MKNKRKLITNLLFVVFIGLLIIPGTRSFLIRMVSFSPSITTQEDRKTLTDYNWTLQQLDGQTVDFEAYKGKVVVVNFWATWCPSCRAEKPSLANLYKQYKDQVEFLFVSNEPNAAIEKYYTDNDYDFPTFKSMTQPPQLIRSNAIPATYIIDKSGDIVVSKVGAADWDSSKITALLDNLLQ